MIVAFLIFCDIMSLLLQIEEVKFLEKVKYFFRDDKDASELLQGRTIKWLANETKHCRRHISEILRHKIGCNFEKADEIVNVCRPDKTFDDYFVLAEAREYYGKRD